MDFQELIRARYSVRGYREDPVEEKKLVAVLEAARLAPTAANRQPFRLVVVPTEGHRAQLRKVYDREWFVQGPLVIVACGLPEEAWVHSEGRSYLYTDVAIAMDHLILAATDQGLGTCWIAAFDPEATREILALPPGWEPIIMTPLGYPAEGPGEKERRPLEDLVTRHEWA
jgi:nitroreductase